MTYYKLGYLDMNRVNASRKLQGFRAQSFANLNAPSDQHHDAVPTIPSIHINQITGEPMRRVAIPSIKSDDPYGLAPPGTVPRLNYGPGSEIPDDAPCLKIYGFPALGQR